MKLLSNPNDDTIFKKSLLNKEIDLTGNTNFDQIFDTNWEISKITECDANFELIRKIKITKKSFKIHITICKVSSRFSYCKNWKGKVCVKLVK